MMDSCLSTVQAPDRQEPTPEVQTPARPGPEAPARPGPEAPARPGPEAPARPGPEAPPSEEGQHLQVYLRIRPFTSAERETGESQGCVDIEAPDTVLLKAPTWSLSGRPSTVLTQTLQRFQFSRVFSPETTQGELFEGTVKHFVRDVLEGGNSLVFTYGVTNAGKTYTFLGPEGEAGILPRSLNVIFGSIDERVFTGLEIKPQRCTEFTRLTREQQVEEATFKRNLFRQFKESEKSNSSLMSSTNKSFLEGSFMLGPGTTAAGDRISLDIDTHTKFSVWVSFCEIYNENIHDLLEVLPTGALRRTALRLSQDVKGNAFVKDLRWVQVNSAEEAYKVLKLGKKNQSFSSTRLNQLSSRSHSIFSIRILKMEDKGTLRVHAVSELCLCDLAGSERCAKTLNKGERLKEAGNINTSLLILGKCISALRHNQQQAKLRQHVPFRESKLTHYLQGFFCGRGKACMIVNINQCASMYDETTNVLKFSAVAQKIVVLPTRPLPFIPERSSSEASVVRESSLEDVQEDENEEYEEETSFMDETDDDQVISKETHEAHVKLLKELQSQLKKEQEQNLVMEMRIREEVCREVTELFSKMQTEYKESLTREREIMEERAEKRLEIFKNLSNKMAGVGQDAQDMNISDVERPSELHPPVQEQQAHTYNGDAGGLDDERELLLQEKTSEVVRLEKLVADLQRVAEGGEREQLQETSAALEKERKAKQDTLADLESQTKAREEALASLEEERKAKEAAVATMRQLKRSEEEMAASLEEERTDKEKTVAMLEAERRAKEEATAALAEVKRSRDETLAALGEERRGKEEAQSVLEVERREIRRLAEERQQEADALQRQVRELTDKLEAKEHQMVSEKARAELALAQLQSARAQLDEQKETSDQVLDEVERKLSEQEQTAELLRAELEESKLKGSDAAEELQKLNSDLHKEVASLRARVSNTEETKASKSEAQLASLEEKLAEVTKASADREAQLQRQLLEKAAWVTSLQEAEERRVEEDSQAVQEAERRRELLAVAHEAIAQKEAELEKKAEEISRLKESTKQDAGKVESLSLDLQRKEDESSDLKEKLADYKKQIQQIQKEISSMREEEKALRQKLVDTEKVRKQLQLDLVNRDRTIQQLKVEQSSDTQLYQKACKDLEAKERVMEDMRLALTEQEETQERMEQVLDEKLGCIQELSRELEKLKGVLRHGDLGQDNPSHDLRLAQEAAAQSLENLKLSTEKHQAERKKWQEEKLYLIGQAKEAEDRRNQEMRKFAEDRERYSLQQSQLDSLSSQLAEKEQTMEKWRQERDALVAALEVQLKKLLCSQAEKDELIQQLRQDASQPPQEREAGVAELQAALGEKEAEILRLKEELTAPSAKRSTAAALTKSHETPSSLMEQPQSDTINRKSAGRRAVRASASSQGSAVCPSVLDSFEIPTENGKTSRFPQPELEISFSPLQPNRVALRRQGDTNAVTVKISRSARKRKSSEMETSHIFRRSKRRTALEEDVKAQNRRNTKRTPKLTPHQEEVRSPAGRHESQSSVCSRKEGTLQKIGDFLQSSPTLLGSKAKKMMSLMSGRAEASPPSLRLKKSKKKLYRPEISSPMELPSPPIISREPEDKESDHQTIKRRLRSRVAK